MVNLSKLATIAKWGKIAGALLAIIGLLSLVGSLYPKLAGLETTEAHTEDINEIKEEWRKAFDILNGKVNCTLLELSYEECPAVRKELGLE